MQDNAWLSRHHGTQCCSPQGAWSMVVAAQSQLTGHQMLRHGNWLSWPDPSSDAPVFWEMRSCGQQPAAAPLESCTACRARTQAQKQLAGMEKAQRSGPKHQAAGRVFIGAPARSTSPFLKLPSYEGSRTDRGAVTKASAGNHPPISGAAFPE